MQKKCINIVFLCYIAFSQDLSLIFAFLHGMEALASLREPALRALCKTARYVHHDANDIIYW